MNYTNNMIKKELKSETLTNRIKPSVNKKLKEISDEQDVSQADVLEIAILELYGGLMMSGKK